MASRIPRRITRTSCLMAALTAAGLLGSPAAHADPTASDRETARSMMTEGRELREKGDLKGALQRFKTADSLMHVPTTGLEVAKTQVALGLLIEARDTVAAIRKYPQGPSDPAPFNEARSKADDLDTAAEGKIPSLTITVGGTADGETPAISIDGASVPASVAGLPRKVDPGHHVVRVRGSSGEASQEVDVSEGENKQVQLVISSGGAVTPPAGNEENGAPKEPSTPETRVHSPTTLTYVSGGAGAAGLIVGAITGVLSLSTASKVKTECPTKVCTSSQGMSDLSSAQTTATISDVGFIVGLVGVGVAVTSLIVGHDASSETPARTPTETGGGNGGDAPSDAPAAPAPESRLRVTPWIGFGSAGVFGTF
jgi:hypothetical protein